MSLFLFFFRFFRHEKEAGKNSLAYACMLSATDSSNHQMADSNRRQVILSFERPIDTTRGRLVPKNFHLPFKHMYEALNVIK